MYNVSRYDSEDKIESESPNIRSTQYTLNASHVRYIYHHQHECYRYISTRPKRRNPAAQPQSLLSTRTSLRRHPITPFPKAASSASPTVRTKTICIAARTSFGTSCSTSLRFAHGRMTLVICARCAPSTFSLIPPTAPTRPRSVTSPVIAMLLGTHAPVSSDTNAHVYSTSAEYESGRKEAYHRDTRRRPVLPHRPTG